MSPVNGRFDLDQQPEVFFSSTDTKAVRRLYSLGRLRKLGPRLYTQNLVDPAEAVVRRNVWPIVAGYFPGSVIVDRTAIEMMPAEDGTVVIAPGSTRTMQLPGLRLRVRPGEGPIEGDTPFMGEDLFMASRARAFLENMRSSRSRGGAVTRTLSRAELEEALHRYAQLDPGALNSLRDQARDLVEPLGAEAEFEKLSQLISDLYGTGDGQMASAIGRAWQAGAAYDQRRIELFEELHRGLLGQALPRVGEQGGTDISTFAFYEAYFSNYIEGTEFTLEEAEEIVFQGRVPAQRPVDAHDILGTYRLVSDPRQRARVPSSADTLVEILKAQHRVMLEKRPDVGPGEFKERPNRVGGSQFVEPHLVEGTLREGWRLYASLPTGIERALFALFVVSEVHPFADGNGRVARILMNSELSAAGAQRIIVPTVERYQYLTALRAMTRSSAVNTLVKVMLKLQSDTALVDFSSRQVAEADLKARGAFDEPDEVTGGAGGLAAVLNQQQRG